jgi:hypothetical protein
MSESLLIIETKLGTEARLVDNYRLSIQALADTLDYAHNSEYAEVDGASL